MKNTKTIQEVTAFAVEQFKAANLRNSRVEASGNGQYAYIQVHRAFSIEGAINVDFRADSIDKKWLPRVTVNFPACNKGIAEATAFLHLVQELTLLAASVQVQLDEFTIPMV